MAPRFPQSLALTVSLLTLGFAGAGVSLVVQGRQTHSQRAQAAHELTGGDAERGKAAFAKYRCGACHAIRGVDGADGETGPALDKIGGRAFLAGSQSNDPSHMVAWVQHPQAVEPGVGMPELGLDTQDARDVAAYLYTLR